MDVQSVRKIEGLLLNRTVAFWLSPEGKEAVKHVFEGKESFRAYVESVDELGIWLRLPPRRGAGKVSNSLLLLKWIYLATAHVEAELAEQEPKKELIH